MTDTASFLAIFQYKDHVSMNMDFHYKDHTAVGRSYPYTGNSYTVKKASLSWNDQGIR